MSSFFQIQMVNGRGSGRAYMSALELELRRRVGPTADLEQELNKLGLSSQYLEDEYDYWHVPQIYLDYRLNVKSIVHRLELWGYVDGEHIYDDPKYAEVVKGYPVVENPEDGDGWVALLLVDPSQGKRCSWDMLDGWNWAELLSRQPQFAEFCAWDKLDAHAWSYLLSATAAFDAKCDFSIFNGVEWTYLVKRRRELAEHLNWSILNDRDHVRIERILLDNPPKGGA